MAIEFVKSKYGWVSVTNYGVVIGTIFIDPKGVRFLVEHPEDDLTIEFIEQILSKMKELQYENSDTGR